MSTAATVEARPEAMGLGPTQRLLRVPHVGKGAAVESSTR